MLSRGIRLMEVAVAEAPGQMALFRSALPETPEQLALLHMSRVKSPRPCRNAP